MRHSRTKHSQNSPIYKSLCPSFPRAHARRQPGSLLDLLKSPLTPSPTQYLGKKARQARSKDGHAEKFVHAHHVTMAVVLAVLAASGNNVGKVGGWVGGWVDGFDRGREG